MSADRRTPGNRDPPLSSTWLEVRENPGEDNQDDNGFILNGVYTPEVVLELLLSFIPPKDILSLSQVCRAWKDITTSRSFWRLVCLRNAVDWSSIPEHLKEREAAWMVFYAATKHKILNKNKNFVQNHSGHENFDNWVIVRSGGDRLIVENPPIGIPALPSDPRFAGLNDSAFVTSYQWSLQKQTIDLWQAGITPAVMMAMLPFQIVCSEMVGSRFDCGGLYKVHLTLENRKHKKVGSRSISGERGSGAGWEEVSLNLLIPVGSEPMVQEARYLVFQNEGKDNRFWAGHYGIKFSRISVFVRCLTETEAQQIAEQDKCAGDLNANESDSDPESDPDPEFDDDDMSGSD